MQTTSRASYKLVSRSDLASQTVGKRRQLMEAEMLKIAISGQKSQPQINESKQWESTTMHDFCHSDVYPPLVKLGSKLPDQSQSDKYAKPITFWSDYAAKGSGTAVCSTPAKYLHKQGYSQEPNNNEVVGHRAGQIHEMQASDVPIRFGKHPTFSCPIHENRFEKE
ncbi:hypothetical protein O5D80_001415 [Batrachochytrium dendrobatidis]|nr:hypothetical protein O5D80_001415 [Batrachochytrium dendrobatidis]